VVLVRKEPKAQCAVESQGYFEPSGRLWKLMTGLGCTVCFFLGWNSISPWETRKAAVPAGYGGPNKLQHQQDFIWAHDTWFLDSVACHETHYLLLVICSMAFPTVQLWEVEYNGQKEKNYPVTHENAPFVLWEKSGLNLLADNVFQKLPDFSCM
jgi:hypothetical protein